MLLSSPSLAPPALADASNGLVDTVSASEVQGAPLKAPAKAAPKVSRVVLLSFVYSGSLLVGALAVERLEFFRGWFPAIFKANDMMRENRERREGGDDGADGDFGVMDASATAAAAPLPPPSVATAAPNAAPAAPAAPAEAFPSELSAGEAEGAERYIGEDGDFEAAIAAEVARQEAADAASAASAAAVSGSGEGAGAQAVTSGEAAAAASIVAEEAAAADARLLAAVQAGGDAQKGETALPAEIETEAPAEAPATAEQRPSD